MKPKKPETIYCSKCVYPGNAVNLQLDDDGVCSACRTAESSFTITDEMWAERRVLFEELLEETTSGREGLYDCLIPVSGGKDSYYQTHKICKEYGLKALLVTYHGNNYLPEGDYNRDRMREVFNIDHMVLGPSVEVLKKLNRIGFRRMGDMNWHAHCGIETYPIQIAVKLRIPLIVWGETPYDVYGMFESGDFAEFSARSRHEYSVRGYEWYDLINDTQDPLTEEDMQWAKYPSDEEILDVGVRGIYIGNYFKWESNKHTELVKEKYQWKEREAPFERTYRKMSNIDDRYENGIHDLLKFVKFGYGRASDHASKDIRSGEMDRETGIEMVRKYDSVVSSDLEYWLNYVDMTESEFWEIADTFRDPRVWWIQNGEWWKDNIWGSPSAHGNVLLPKEMWDKYYTC